MSEACCPHIRAARRLTRLFRLEREGRFARCSIEIMQRLVARRAALIAQLPPRRSAGQPPDLDVAMRELAAEVERSRPAAQQRRDELSRAIRFERRTASGIPTGLRGEPARHLLGRG